MVFRAPTNFSLFKQRREQLREIIKEKYPDSKGVVMVGAGFETERSVFRQESSFYYLTGVTEPAIMMVMTLDGNETLYTPRFVASREQWVQTTIKGPQDAALIGVDRIAYLGGELPGYSVRPIFTKSMYENLIADLAPVLQGGGKVFTLLDRNNGEYAMYINLFEHCAAWLPGLMQATVDVAPLAHAMRRNKDEYEIDLIYKAVQITNMAHRAVATMIVPDVFEYELQATVDSVFKHVAAAVPAFPSIVASGKNSTVLHYAHCYEQLRADDLVVIDIGAEYGGYAADITRTYPVGGIFTARQREIYQAVLDTQQYVESLAKPGMYLKNPQRPEQSLHHMAVTFLERKGLAKYFCHGIGHYLGLDVHDVGAYDMPLLPGDVFTLEPGVYSTQENIGIRIEDDFVMADDGAVCLSYELSKRPEEIEEMMRDR